VHPLVVPVQFANPDRVAILEDMGFTAAAATIALVRCGNQISRAADYLLAHPELANEAAFSNKCSQCWKQVEIVCLDFE
jgi:E3 ubiquitin-protein ligase HUWE1